MNGFIADKGRLMGIATPANEKITAIVVRVERGAVAASAALLGG